MMDFNNDEFKGTCALVFTIVYAIVTAVIFIIASFMVQMIGDLEIYLSIMMPYLHILGYATAFLGHLSSLNGLILWLSAMADKKKIIEINSFFTILFCFVCGIAGFSSFALMHFQTEDMENHVHKAIMGYNEDITNTTFMNVMHSRFGCCGSSSYLDYVVMGKCDCTNIGSYARICKLPPSCCTESKLRSSYGNCMVKVPRYLDTEQMHYKAPLLNGVYSKGCFDDLNIHVIASNHVYLFYVILLVCFKATYYCLQVKMFQMLEVTRSNYRNNIHHNHVHHNNIHHNILHNNNHLHDFHHYVQYVANPEEINFGLIGA